MLRVTYIGHATLLIEIGKRRILTDPNFDSALGRFLPPVAVSWALVAGAIVSLLILLILGTVVRAVRAARLDPVVALRVT